MSKSNSLQKVQTNKEMWLGNLSSIKYASIVVVKVVQTDSVAQEQDDRNISQSESFFQTKATLNNTNYGQEKKV